MTREEATTAWPLAVAPRLAAVASLVPAAKRLRALVVWMHRHAAAGHPAFSRHVAEGHDRRYLTDARWIEDNFAGNDPDIGGRRS
jgi:hypothetical protein